jgi:hypothetical protein
VKIILGGFPLALFEWIEITENDYDVIKIATSKILTYISIEESFDILDMISVQ